MSAFKRVVTGVLVAVMLASSVAACAKDDCERLTVDNFTVTIGDKRYDVGVGLNIDTGNYNDRGFLNVGVTDGENEIVKIRSTTGDEGIKAAINGMSDAYLYSKQHMGMISENRKSEQESFYSTDEFSGAIASLAKIIERDKNDKKLSDEITAGINKEVLEYLSTNAEISENVPFKVFDYEAVGQNAAIQITMEDADAIVGIIGKNDELRKELYGHLLKLLSSVIERNGGEKFDTFSEYTKKNGVTPNYRFDVSVEEGKATKAEYNIMMKKDGYVVHVGPIVIESLKDESGLRSALYLDNISIGSTQMLILPLDFRVEWYENADSKTGFDVDASFGHKAHGSYQKVHVGYSSLGDKRESDFQFDGYSNAKQLVAARVSYDGTVCENETGFESDARLKLAWKVKGGEKVYIASDVRYVDIPVSNESFVGFDELPVVSFDEMDTEQTDKAVRELSTIGVKALGELMQAPGMAELIAKLADYGTALADMEGNSAYFVLKGSSEILTE